MRSIKSLSLVLFITLLAALLAGCASSNPATPPDQVVGDFYHWYLGYPGNPLADRAYQNRSELAPAFVAEVDALLASDEGGHYDPFLLAQDIPIRIDVEPGTLLDDVASVLIQQFWGGNDTPRDLEVQLVLVDDNWLMAGVSEMPIDPPDPAPADPDGGEPQPAADQASAPGDEQEPEASISYRPTAIEDGRLSMDMPESWQRQEPDWIWTPEQGCESQIGLRWQTLEPPQEAEAVLLPVSSQILDAKPVELDWGSGRHFRLQVLATGEQDTDERGAVLAEETHFLVVTTRDGERWALDLYGSAATADELAELAPILVHMLGSITLTD